MVSYTLLKLKNAPATIIWACPLIFLAKRFNTPYYRVLMIPGTSGHEFVRQVDVLQGGRNQRRWSRTP